MASEKITIILPDLRGGGAERLHVHLANDWILRGYAVDIVLMQKRGELIPLLSPNVRVIELGADRIRQMILPLSKHLKKSKSDIILAAMWPLTSVASIAWLLAKRDGRLFLSDHTQLSVACIQELGVNSAFLKAIMRTTYPIATGIIGVSQGVKSDLVGLGSFSDEKVKVIYNPAATGISPHKESRELRFRLWGEGARFHILSVGALKRQKDHETLIRAFALLPPDINAKLSIVGEGPLRGNLEALVSQNHLDSSVLMPGYVNDPYPWFRTADLFVLSSQWEGFGNVIVEALECGVPVVSTDCPSGPAEILENGRYGKLVPTGNPEAMAKAIASTLGERADEAALMDRAKEFSVATISDQYLQYFFSAEM